MVASEGPASEPPVKPTERLAPGMVLGRYELLLPIAQGGMATVWAARQKGSRGFQKTVAVKTMLPALSDDPQFEQMFLDEASLAAKIHHPNVAEILDLGEQDDIIYLVMEWVDGEALSVIAKTAKKSQSAVPQRIVLRIVGQACAGLHAAHELRNEDDQLVNLVHRDVSPQNILVTYDGVVKLVDFGVAKAIGRAGGETTAGQLKGKVPYMSPEQARGGQVDRRTDVFAMGIVLYKLTVGVHPFLGESDLITMRNIITRPVLPPRVKNPNFSPELEQVLLTCLQKDPDKRYQTVADLDRAIDRVLAITGASVVDDDVGAFVRAVMGDRGQKRRMALKDAVRAADERAAAGIPVAPVIHDRVSELVLTRMSSGVKEEMLPEELPDVPQPPMMPPPIGVGATEEQLAIYSQMDPGKKRRSMALVLALSAITTVGIGLILLKATSSSGGATESASPQTAASTVAPAPPAATAAPPAAATAAAQAPATSATAPALSLDDLPSAGTPRPTGGGKRPVTGPGPKPKEPQEPKPAPAPAPKPAGTGWVPSVQNPGF